MYVNARKIFVTCSFIYINIRRSNANYFNDFLRIYVKYFIEL